MQEVKKAKGSGRTRRVSRRDFIKASAAISLTALMPGAGSVFAARSEKLRVGLIGCGRRGTGAAKDCVNSAPNVEIAAMGDLFKDQLDKSRSQLAQELDRDWLKVTDRTCFVGFDAYEKVIAADVDLVILATPPHFRPEHLKATVEAGKHVFMEKPVAVDPGGVRSIIATSELATEKNLSIVAGTQRRHQNHYLEVMKRIHGGDIGEIVSAQCYWIGDYDYYTAVLRQPGWSDMEWQCRNWNYFTWLSGDHIVEQHVHNIDIINWAIGSHPVKAMGMGGREVRTGAEYGHIFDHFAVEYEYPGGVRVLSMCRQMSGCSHRVSERLVGTTGSTYTDGANGYIEGQKPFKYEGSSPNPYVQEHANLIASIREGRPLNEGRQVAESTLTAIMGRMSAYTGRELKWDWVIKESKLDLTPPKYEMGDLPVAAVAVPGKTKLY
ncbi:MAG: gfo/Idh/MocA family oxidoreductase [Calditrichaeota bacterium]|nr:gfo/Idh/MocA family oxidoreductase [Calditrichota bacterium]